VKITLYSYWRSSASYRARIGLGLKNLKWEYAAVNIVAGEPEQRTETYRSKNPMQQVPTLEIVEDDGRRIFIPQSLPILEYLDERWPDPAILPSDPYLRARARALAEIVNAGIQPFQNVPVVRKVKAAGGDDKAWVQGFVADGLAAFDAQAQATAGHFCVGDQPSIADCCLIPQLYSARRFGVDPSAWRTLLRIEAACNELPGFAAAHPDRQPDAPVSKS
jgi:maleylpyruvate isomerase